VTWTLFALALAVGSAAERFPEAGPWGEVRVTADRVPAAEFAVSPSGTEILFYGYHRTLHLYDIAQGRVVREVPCDKAPHDVAYSPDGKLLATADWTFGVRLRDPKTLQVFDTLKPEADLGASAPAFQPGGKLAVYCWRMQPGPVQTFHEQIAVWDLATKKQIGWPATKRQEANGEMIRRRFPGNGRHLLSIETKQANGYIVDRSATLTDPAANKESAKVALDMDDDFVFDASPDGRTLLVFNLNRPPRLVDVATGKTTRMLIGHRNYVSCGAFSPDGKLVATASGTTRRTNLMPKAPPPAGSQTEIILWDTATGRKVATLSDAAEAHDYYRIAFGPDGEFVVAVTRPEEPKQQQQLRGGKLILWGKLPKAVAAAKVDEPPAPKTVGDDLPAGSVGRVGGAPRFLHPGGLRDFAIAPDGKTLATAGGNATQIVWDLATGRMVRQLTGHKGTGGTVQISPDGKWLATSGGEAGISLREFATGQEVARLATQSVTTAAFSPDSRILAVVHGGNSTRIDLFDVASRSLLRSVAKPVSARQIVFSPDGRTLAANSLERTVWLYEVATGQLRGQIDNLAHQLAGMAFSPDGEILYIGAGDKPLVAHDPLTGRLVRMFDAPAWQVSVSPDGETVAAYGFKGEVRLLEASTGKLLRKWQAQPGPMQQIAFTPDGKTLATSGWQNARVHLYDVGTGKELSPGTGHSAAVMALAVSLDGKTLATAGGDRAVQLWELPADGPARPLRRIETDRLLTFQSLAFSPDGRRLAGAASSGKYDEKMVRVWEVASGREVLALQGPDDPRGASYPVGSGAVAFSPDGTKLATGGHDAGFHLWDLDTGKELLRLGSGRPGAVGLAFSPDGKAIYTARINGAVEAWSLEASADKPAAGPPVRTFTGHQGSPFCLAAARNAPVLVTGAADDSMRVWDTATGEQVFRGTGHEGYVHAVAVTPDGKLAASAGSDGVVRLWDLEARGERATFRGHKGRVTALAFTPDGQRLISAGQDAAVFVWAMPAPSELDSRWGELAGADAARAYRAVRGLAGQPDKAVPYLAERWPRPATVNVSQLVAQLAHPKTAEAAAADLARLGVLAEPELRRMREQFRGDIRERVDRLLDPKRPIAYPNEGLRLLRAVEVLERIGSADARRLLSQVAADWKETAAGRDAAAALERLGRSKP